MGLWDGAGMQQMLGNMVKMAAPDLIEKVEEFQKLVISFKQQLDRVEQQQSLILSLLNATAENDHGRIGKIVEGHSGPAGETGSAASECNG